jgi:hypothetical protein
VSWLLGDASLADVAVWADQYVANNHQTSFWHYVNIPLDAVRYDRERDCPTQTGAAAGGRGDRYVTAWWTGSCTTRNGWQTRRSIVPTGESR